jgi:thioredoxin
MSQLVHVDDANYDEVITKSQKPALLDFGAAWCGPCKTLEPAVVALAGEYGDRVTVGKLDIDKAPQAALRFGIMSVPTVVFLKDGKEVHRFIGVQSKEKIASLIQSHLLTG